MFRSVFLLGLLVAFVQSYAQHQVQMPEASALLDQDEGLFAQVQELQKNVTEIWTYIHTLRNAVTEHLNHLRQHQVELESTVHRLEHAGQSGTHTSHTDDHHSGEHGHSHSSEHHSHSGEHGHSHSSEHGHSHSGEHGHSHSGERSSHGDDHQHSHSGEQHSHSGGDDHHHESHSHSHTSEASPSSHTDGDHQHIDHHESEDLQQSQQGADPLPEPLIVPVHRQSHTHHHHTHGSSASSTPKPIGMQLMTEQGHHHHHHHNHQAPQSMSSVRNLTREAIVMPKYSEYALYDMAVCNVQPNRAIPESQQQNVQGQITLWQKISGGPLNVLVRLQGFSMGDHHGAHQAIQTLQSPHGALHQAQSEDNEEAPAKGHKHGFHVHTNGDLSNGCQSTGPHFNPKSVNHGGPNALVRHVGDFGKIECDDHGITNQVFSDNIASLTGPYSIIGKSMVIHSLEDDLGLGGDEESLRTGNAGTRIACCVIHKAEKLPIRSYKAMKTAVQRKN